MFDLEIYLEDRPGELALLGETLGSAAVSIEGGGMWLIAGRGVAHFLVADAEKAVAALEAVGISVVTYREAIVQRLNQDEPGQLGKFCRALANEDVNIEVLYSDHDNQLVIVTDRPDVAKKVSACWMSQRNA